MSKGEAGPSFDPQQEASDALQRLLGADVVLTSYEVLRQEVHYSPESASIHSLRRAKKYAVPESPLLSVRSVGLCQLQLVLQECKKAAYTAWKTTCTGRTEHVCSHAHLV